MGRQILGWESRYQSPCVLQLSQSRCTSPQVLPGKSVSPGWDLSHSPPTPAMVGWPLKGSRTDDTVPCCAQVPVNTAQGTAQASQPLQALLEEGVSLFT